MDEFLDLDAIVPQKKQIKLNGIMHDVLPASLNDFVLIQKVFLKMQSATTADQTFEAIQEVNDVLEPVIPDIKSMRLTMDQLLPVLKFVYTASSVDKKTMETTEKKTDLVNQ